MNIKVLIGKQPSSLTSLSIYQDITFIQGYINFSARKMWKIAGNERLWVGRKCEGH